jgi:hypothetical protein
MRKVIGTWLVELNEPIAAKRSFVFRTSKSNYRLSTTMAFASVARSDGFHKSLELG